MSTNGEPREVESPYRGGEKSIEDFGTEALGSDRHELLTTFQGYLKAMMQKDFHAACSYLAADVQRSLEQLVRAKEKPLCAAILPRLLTVNAAATAREQAAGPVTKVRIEGDRAFIVFRAPGAERFQMTMSREHGRWKAATVAASVLIPSAETLGH